MKVVKSAEHYTETALDEIKLLRAVSYPDTSAALETITINYSRDHLVSDEFDSVPQCGGKVMKVRCIHMPDESGFIKWKHGLFCNKPKKWFQNVSHL